MKKFNIEVLETYRATYEVIAESKEDAERKYFDTEDYKEIYHKNIEYDYEVNEVDSK